MLPRKYRLNKKTDFENVRQNGKFISTPLFLFSFWNRHTSDPSRFGFIVSKKISLRAHERNKVKRTLRAIIGKNLNSMKNGVDIVFLAKHGILKANFDKIEKEVKNVLENI